VAFNARLARNLAFLMLNTTNINIFKLKNQVSNLI
jgi:hypothetical protein